MKDNNISKDNFTSDELNLLDVINTSNLSVEDVRWLKSKRWFKRFIKIYSRELKKRYKNKPVINKPLEPKEEDIEILDFTKTIDVTDIKEVTKATDKAKKRVKVEKKIWSSIITLSSLIVIVLLVILVNWYLENRKTEEIINDIYEVAEVKEIITTTTWNEEQKETTTKTTVLSDYYEYANMNILDVNFDNLKNINNDTAGWIKVEGTKINYPFVKTTDNEYYLKHSFDKSSNKKGWVYLDYRNNIDNLSKNNILYAHGLVNNTMFGSMRNVIKSSWYTNKNNHIIRLVTPTSNQLWQVFSTYTILPESYYITTSFLNDEEYTKFLDTIKSRSVYDYGVTLNSNDIVLTLSSCYDNEKRMVLHAKLISKESK